jgi:flagellar hook-associated protein 2
LAITSAGIGSGLNIESIITQLMTVEAAPLSTYDTKAAAFQAKLTALGKLSTGVSAFQSSLSPLSNSSTYNVLSATAANASVVAPTASSTAVAGSYSVSVSQLAQAQSLNTRGVATTTANLGGGVNGATLSFQFGTVTAGTFGVTGAKVGAAAASTGMANGTLTINGKAIATDGTTTGSKQLAAAINAQSATTGVTASAGVTSSADNLFGSFGDIATGAGSNYSLSVNGIVIAAQGSDVAAGEGVTMASLKAALSEPNEITNALAAAKITFTGTEPGGDLKFFAADGSTLNIAETVVGKPTGGIGGTGENAGSSNVATSAVTLTSTGGSPITVAGSNPALAGLTAGSSGSYTGAGFTQDGSQASGVVTLDPKDQTLQGIRDAINKAGIGVTASIVSDGSDTPYHLVLTSTKTGEASSMNISVSGVGATPADPALASLLTYDPAGVQALTQTTAAQSTKLTVNGIAVTSASNSVTGAIQGVTLAIGAVGSTSVVVAKDTTSVKSAVTAFVKAYNDLNTTIKGLTAYNADTNTGGALLGDSGALAIQTRLRQQLGKAVEGLSGDLTTMSQVGISFQKDGSLLLDSTKLSTAITNNFSDIAGLFSAIGTATDSLVSFTSSTAATKPGTYPLYIEKMASQGKLASDTALGPTTVIEPNTVWSVTLNQTDPTSSTRVADVPLTAGSYTPTQLAALLRAAINGNSSFSANGDTVETSLSSDNKLTLSSSRYGAISNLEVTKQSGTAVSTLFGGATTEPGVDVKGTMGGMAFTGSGQTLTGAAGSNMEGLKVLINGGVEGDRGSVTFSQGYAYQLSNLAASFIGTDGLITSRADGLNSSIKTVTTQRQTFSDKLVDIEKRLRAQYTALDVSLASMQSTQTYLTQQLAAIAANT